MPGTLNNNWLQKHASQYGQLAEDTQQKYANSYLGQENKRFSESITDLLNTNIASGSDEYNVNIPDQMNDFAERGYGPGWIRNMFQLGTDEAAMQKNAAETQLNQMSATQLQGGTDNKMIGRPRDRVQFGFMKDSGKLFGDILGKNQAVQVDAKTKLGLVENENENYDSYVDYLNRSLHYAGESMVQDRGVANYIYQKKKEEEDESARQANMFAGSKFVYNTFKDIFGE